jgi:hypothetical protein
MGQVARDCLLMTHSGPRLLPLWGEPNRTPARRDQMQCNAYRCGLFGIRQTLPAQERLKFTQIFQFLPKLHRLSKVYCCSSGWWLDFAAQYNSILTGPLADPASSDRGHSYIAFIDHMIARKPKPLSRTT